MDDMMKTMLCGNTGGGGGGASYKLIYFDIAGKAEAIRLMFAFTGMAFEDYRFSSREEFMEMKASGSLMRARGVAARREGRAIAVAAGSARCPRSRSRPASRRRS